MIVNLIILCLIIISSVCLYCCKECGTELKYILLLFGGILFIIQLQKLINNNMNENFNSAEANEVLQNIASLYNAEELTVSKLNVTGDLAVNGKSSFGGDIKGDRNLNITGTSTFGDTTCNKNFKVNGVSTFDSDVIGTKNLNISGKTTFGGDLAVKGISSFDSDIIGTKNLNISGKTTFGDITTCNKNFKVSGESIFENNIIGSKSLIVAGKSSFGDDITSAKKLTTTDASIGNLLYFTNKDDPTQKETWYIHNWADRLNMRSNKSNTGGVLLTNNYYGNGTVATFYDNKGTTKMLVGTSSVNAGDTTRGVVNIYNANGSGRWGMGDSS